MNECWKRGRFTGQYVPQHTLSTEQQIELESPSEESEEQRVATTALWVSEWAWQPPDTQLTPNDRGGPHDDCPKTERERERERSQDGIKSSAALRSVMCHYLIAICTMHPTTLRPNTLLLSVWYERTRGRHTVTSGQCRGLVRIRHLTTT